MPCVIRCRHGRPYRLPATCSVLVPWNPPHVGASTPRVAFSRAVADPPLAFVWLHMDRDSAILMIALTIAHVHCSDFGDWRSMADRLADDFVDVRWVRAARARR